MQMQNSNLNAQLDFNALSEYKAKWLNESNQYRDYMDAIIKKKKTKQSQRTQLKYRIQEKTALYHKVIADNGVQRDMVQRISNEKANAHFQFQDFVEYQNVDEAFSRYTSSAQEQVHFSVQNPKYKSYLKESIGQKGIVKEFKQNLNKMETIQVLRK
ncbi:Hypothetical_protein [Hexamita inflata]|uniref:Hypothetical_protein n=1 Tax=Hexamita inflata TaxID=28002 RepID=A0AA86NUE0_9EUKA|nr:Hypothetical protein HINF_LOCUS14005 [Hexamita inflata]